MGCCLSKSDPCSKSPPFVTKTQQNDQKYPSKMVSTIKLDQPNNQIDTKSKEGSEKIEEIGERKDLLVKKKEVFVIQHRKSNDKRLDSDGSGSNSSDLAREPEEIGRDLMAAAASGQVIRTSSCTKEEVDAILIQCGRLSRSSSGKVGHGRRYSGSKRSFDFDRENEVPVNDVNYDDDDGDDGGNGDGDERSRSRRSRGSHRRRATLSRSRERGGTPQGPQRSGSRERSQSNGRRVSRSPGRRSESPIVGQSSGNGNSNGNLRPGKKLVSVPATVTSLSVDKGHSSGNVGEGGNVKRVLVKRNVGSPRSQSPARAQSPGKGGNGNGNGGQQAVSLSRNGSRNREQSPYRRTPLNEIDVNSLPFHPLSNKKGALQKGKEVEEDVGTVKVSINSGFQQNKFTEANNAKSSTQGTHRRTNSRGTEIYEVTKTNYCRVNESQTPNVDQMIGNKREQLDTTEYDAMVTPIVISGTDTQKLPQTLVRSRSGRRSRDLDINVEALLAPNPATNYNSLLLQDIQNFHQKSSNSNSNPNSNPNSCNNNAVSSNIDSSSTPSFTLPACVTKACSILEAVADLNSTTVGSNLKSPKEPNLYVHNGTNKRVDHSNDPFVESVVKVGDDLMEPSLHKYVTVRKRGGDMEDEESSGSNSFVGGECHQNWVSSSSWEPTSADSSINNCWTSKTYSREDVSPVGFQRLAISDLGCGSHEESEKKFGKTGVARNRTVSGRGPISTSKPGAASM